MPERMVVDQPWGGLNGTIARAEAACTQYREAAEAPQASLRGTQVRRSKFRIMEQTLARLQAQKASADDC